MAHFACYVGVDLRVFGCGGGVGEPDGGLADDGPCSPSGGGGENASRDGAAEGEVQADGRRECAAHWAHR